MWAIVRLRGNVNKKEDVLDTLRMLKLTRKMHCVLIDEKNPCVKGMIQKVKDNITWGEINDDILKKMVVKRGRKSGDVKLTEEEATDAFNEIKAGKKPEIKSVFRLTPPSKGFKHSIKQQYPKGELGYRGEKINDLLERMI